jgi:2,4-dienoyl-CoA reductase (NADPH2)
MMNYRTGRESEIYLKPASSKQTVVVIGGGPAGMEAARVARIRGHEVTLLEKTDRLGGQLNLAAVPPGKKRFLKVIEYLEKQLQDLGVQIKVNTEADLKTIQALTPAAIIFAIGAEPIVPPIKGIEKIPYSFARTIFQKQKVDEAVKRVLILGGGQVGCELSKLLLSENKNVCLVEISDRLAGEMEFGSRNILLEVLFSYEKNFQPYTSTEISDVKSSSVCQLRRYNEIFEIQDIDMLIIAAGSQACRPFWDNKTITGKAYIIGDAKQPRSALEAIHEGFQAGAAV